MFVLNNLQLDSLKLTKESKYAKLNRRQAELALVHQYSEAVQQAVKQITDIQETEMKAKYVSLTQGILV